MGIPRSGTTILHRTFTQHKDTAYFERYSSKFYKYPRLFPLIKYALKYQKWRYGITHPKATEGWVWDRFYERLDHLTETDVTEEIKQYYYSAMKAELEFFNAHRFVSKKPEHCLQIRWLNKMFPDAYYILIWRDPKAVISSNLEKLEKLDWNSITSHPYKKILKTFQKDLTKVEGLINYYNYMKEILLQDLSVVKKKLIEIRYQDLVQDTQGEIKKLYDFVDLRLYKELDTIIPKELNKKNDEKWKKLPDKEKEILLKNFPDSY